MRWTLSATAHPLHAKQKRPTIKQKRLTCKAKETYCKAKETYYKAKETYYKAKETWTPGHGLPFSQQTLSLSFSLSVLYMLAMRVK